MAATCARFLLHRVARSSHRQSYHSLPACFFPIKDVALEALPLGETEASWLDHPDIGSLVTSGSVVGVLETKSAKETMDVVTPVSGKLIYAHEDEDSNYAAIGDTLISIDTDASDAVLIQNHLDENNDKLLPGFIESLLERDDNPDRHHDVAVFLRDHFLESHGKQALEILKNVKNRFDGDKSKVAAIHTDVGVLHQRLGNFEAAQTHMQFAVDLQQQLVSDKSTVTPEIEENLMKSLFLLAGIKHDLKDVAGARADLNEVLQLELKLLGDDHVAVADTHYNLAALHYEEGQLQPAIAHYKSAIKIYELKYGLEHVDTANAYQMLAVASQQVGDLKAAYENALAALKIRHVVQGEEHIDTASVHLFLGQVMTEFGAELTEIEEHYKAALSITTECFGREHQLVSNAAANFGSVYYQYQDFDKAIEQFQDCLDIRESIEADAGEIASIYNSLGLAWYQKGELGRALDLHEQAYRILSELQQKGGSESELATAMAGKGNVLKQRHDFNEALKEYERAHDILVRTMGLKHPDVGSSWNNIGQIHAAQGNFDVALANYGTAKEIFEMTLGDKHPHVAACRFNIGLVYKEQGKVQEARQQLEQAHELWTETLGAQNPQTKAVERMLATLTK